MKEIKLNEVDFSYGRLSTIFKGRSLAEDLNAGAGRRGKADSDVHGYTLLIRGLPGTGKTTFGLKLLHDLSREHKEFAHIFTLVESVGQILKILEIYGMEKPWVSKVGSPEISFIHPANQLEELDSILEVNAEVPRLLMIDGISILKYDEDEGKAVQQKMHKIIQEISRRRIFAIIISEEHLPGQDRFFEYSVDGILNLSLGQDKRERYFEFTKLRWTDYYAGKHAFRLQSNQLHPSSPGVIIFPSISCYSGKFSEYEDTSKSSSDLEMSVRSGIDNFDGLIHNRQDGSFVPGEAILLIGGPGSGKTLFGMHFLKEILMNDASKERPTALCISFDYRYSELERFLSNFSGEVGFKNLLSDEKEVHFVFFNPTETLLPELTNTIVNYISRYNISRIFIDSISSLQRRFGTREEYNNFVSSLIKIIKARKKTVLLTYEIPNMFQSYSEVEIPFAEEIHTIIGLRFYDINNTIQRGLVILKSLGNAYDTSLKTIQITSDKGLYIDLEAGWARIGLLAGVAEQISEAKLFFKYFYQNKSHEEVHKEVFETFKDKYPAESTFKRVHKDDPHPFHWSWKGYFGSGHSNTKVVSVRKYLLDILRENGVLTDIPSDVQEQIKKHFEPGFLWNDIYDLVDNEEKRQKGFQRNYQMVPHYADVGVFVYHRDIIETLQVRPPSTWEDLIKIKHEFQIWSKTFEEKQKAGSHKGKVLHHLFVLPNTVRDARAFVTFFFELLWTKGGKFFHNDFSDFRSKHRSNLKVACRKEFEKSVKSQEFHETLLFLKQLVEPIEGEIPEPIPDPNYGGHYHEALFSRRWFSKILLYPEDAYRRHSSKHEMFQFAITPLPKFQNASYKQGCSCIDLYCLGIIKGALAAETGSMFISDLLEYPPNRKRCLTKRGLPIRKDLYATKEIQDNFNATPYPEHYGEEFFADWYSNIEKILGLPDPPCGHFKRTSDIPYFYNIERILAAEIRKIFKPEEKSAEEVQQEICRRLGTEFK